MPHSHDVDSRLWPLNPGDTALAREFRARPFGPHSPPLRMLLDRMRFGPLAGKYVLVRQGPAAWALARLSGRRGVAPALAGPVYGSPAEAEWAVFVARWTAMAGRALDLADG